MCAYWIVILVSLSGFEPELMVPKTTVLSITPQRHWNNCIIGIEKSKGIVWKNIAKNFSREYNKNMKSKKKKKIIGGLVAVVCVLVLIVSIFALTFNIVYTKSSVIGNSMYPTLNLQGTDRIFINKFNKGDIGNIVVADISKEANWDHTLEGRYIIKRMVAKGGDTVKIVETEPFKYRVLINGNVYTEKTSTYPLSSYINFKNYVNLNLTDTQRIQDGAIVLQQGEVFLMGDNWDSSYDCTTCGPILSKSLVGRVDIVVPYKTNLFKGIIKGIFKMWFK